MLLMNLLGFLKVVLLRCVQNTLEQVQSLIYSFQVKSVVVDLLLYESEIDSHRMVLVSCIGALTDILEYVRV